MGFTRLRFVLVIAAETQRIYAYHEILLTKTLTDLHRHHARLE